MIVTFYSYKGGTGRTMALANIAALLAQRGKQVLAVDFDLEAPGLWRYFTRFHDHLDQRDGLIDLLATASLAEDSSGIDWRDYVTEIAQLPGGLSLLTSGKQDGEYPAKVLGFDWADFFKNASGGAYIEHLRREWKAHYDFTLIDSRTGVTDSGGICTIMLPDLIVPVFVSNQQSLEGVVDVIGRVQAGRTRLAYDRPPATILPIMSRFDSRTEYASAQEWLDIAANRLAPFYDDWLPARFSPREALERTKLPYVAYFSFGETLPVLTERTSDPESLSYAMNAVSQLIEGELANAEAVIIGDSATSPVRAEPSILRTRERDGRETPLQKVSAQPDSRAPLFFLSYARSGSGSQRSFTRFFDDLSENVSQLVSIPGGSYPGYMDRSIGGGSQWAGELLEAIGTCQVFVAMLSVPYFRSEWCGMEWFAFSRRQVVQRQVVGNTDNALAQPSAILPVVWAAPLPIDQTPTAIAGVQQFSPGDPRNADLSERYEAEGIIGLLRMKGDLYEAVVWKLAQRIAGVYYSYSVEPRVLQRFQLLNAFQGGALELDQR